MLGPVRLKKIWTNQCMQVQDRSDYAYRLRTVQIMLGSDFKGFKIKSKDSMQGQNRSNCTSSEPVYVWSVLFLTMQDQINLAKMYFSGLLGSLLDSLLV